MRVFTPKLQGDKPFPFYLRRSFYVHIGLVLLTVTTSKVAFELTRAQRDANIELVQASVRVDMVAMPTHTLKELQNMSSGVEEVQKEEPAPVAEAKAEEKTPEPVKEEPKEVVKETTPDPVPALEEAKAAAKREDFLNKLKKLGSKKIEDKGTTKAEKGLYGEKSTELKALVLSGNKLSKGSQMYGDGPSGDLTAFQEYTLKVTRIVKPKWTLPQYLADKKLKCRVRIWLSENGELTRATIYEPSGDQDYDQRAIEAVRAAAPFPPLAENLGNRAQQGHIVLGFPL